MDYNITLLLNIGILICRTRVLLIIRSYLQYSHYTSGLKNTTNNIKHIILMLFTSHYRCINA